MKKIQLILLMVTLSVQAVAQNQQISMTEASHALMPLGELETYIAAHSHLPGVPTAEEVEQEGVDLGEMNKALMEKVEELTLYIIDLQKQIDELKSNK